MESEFQSMKTLPISFLKKTLWLESNKTGELNCNQINQVKVQIWFKKRVISFYHMMSEDGISNTAKSFSQYLEFSAYIYLELKSAYFVSLCKFYTGCWKMGKK